MSEELYLNLYISSFSLYLIPSILEYFWSSKHNFNFYICHWVVALMLNNHAPFRKHPLFISSVPSGCRTESTFCWRVF